MAELIAVAASAIAIIQISDRVISLCKFYLESVQGAPSELRVILLEISALKTLFETLKFLHERDSGVSDAIKALSSNEGPVAGCLQSINELEKLFPQTKVDTGTSHAPKKRRLNAALRTLAWPLKENKAKRLLEDILKYKTTIALGLTTETVQDVKEIQKTALEIQEMLTESERQDVYKWLHHTDPSPLHHRAQKQYEPGTGAWVLRSPDWASWLDATRRCFWIHGIPGAGKTVLISHLIEQLKWHCDQPEQKDCALVYYYCYFAHNQDETIPLLRWLILQLCRKAKTVPSNVYTIYRNGGEPSVGEFMNALASIIDHFQTVYIVVDAIDESALRNDLLDVFREMMTHPRFKKLQLLTSSREYFDIERVMKEISFGMSMANPFAEADIRLHVRSILQVNPKFKRWSQELLDEVEEALSTGARGMFRWAVCQIDVLRRLKPERDIIKKALANLPVTLDETYDRIFLSIPKDEHIFVHYVLQWIDHHNKLYDGEGIPCSTLLQAVEQSTAGLIADHQERYYDEETLREVCGCLIRNTIDKVPDSKDDVENYVTTVSFAHYTVREYLVSTRSSIFVPGPFTADANLAPHLVELTLSEACRINVPELQDWNKEPYDHNEPHWEIWNLIKGAFSVYCTVTALHSLYKFSKQISEQNSLYSLAIDLMDPTQPHFRTCSKVFRLLERKKQNFWPRNFVIMGHFWGLEWNSSSFKDPNAVILFNLLLMGNVSVKSLVFAEKFLQRENAKDCLQSRLTFKKMNPYFTSSDGYLAEIGETIHFDQPVVEVIAHYIDPEVWDMDPLRLLLKYGAGAFDPSEVLLYLAGYHRHGWNETCDAECPMKQLLELGASPAIHTYKVTPLQIAVSSLDFTAVSILLRNGARPNDVGNKDGKTWKPGSPMHRFNHLHGISPLHICRNSVFHLSAFDQGRLNRHEKKAIESLLLQCGAKDLHNPARCPF